jgi:hypothetical protein
MKMALQRNAHAAVDYDVLGALDAVAEIPAP